MAKARTATSKALENVIPKVARDKAWIASITINMKCLCDATVIGGLVAKQRTVLTWTMKSTLHLQQPPPDSTTSRTSKVVHNILEY